MKRSSALLIAIIAAVFTVAAQNFGAFRQDYTSPPPAGDGSMTLRHHPRPQPGGNGFGGPAIGVNGPGWTGHGFGPHVPMWGTSPGMMIGGPWGDSAFSGPDNPPMLNFNNGISHVVGVGYDVQGVWETVPLIVEWHWNGAQYDVTLMNAWNPWTRVWETQLNIPAYQTAYALRGVTYEWYVNLSTGTYYFNL